MSRELQLIIEYLGQDLSGNTFWEFKDAITSNRWRRIVRFRNNAPLSDAQVTPQWHQWLKHTRYEPPSIQEQQADLARQSQLRYLAQVADERWASKPSLLNKPKGPLQTAPAENKKNDTIKRTRDSGGVKTAVDAPAVEPSKPKPSPWDRKGGNPGGNWQPEAWTPGAARR